MSRAFQVNVRCSYLEAAYRLIESLQNLPSLFSICILTPKLYLEAMSTLPTFVFSRTEKSFMNFFTFDCGAKDASVFRNFFKNFRKTKFP